MNMLRRWLRNGFASDATSADRRNPRRRVQPALERLEDRCTPAVTFHGGVTLPHVEVESLFYGANWYNNSTLYQDTGYLNGFLQTITNSSYMDMLTQAGYNVGRGQSLDGPISLANVPGSVDDSQIQSVLQGYISNGVLQPPDGNRLYFVFVEPNVVVTAGGANSVNNFLGYHFAFLGHDASGRMAAINYAVIPFPGGPNAQIQSLSALQGVTEVSSHELSEAVTDPEPSGIKGWFDDAYGNAHQGEGEIGDIVNGQYVTWNGYVVQKEAGQDDQPLTPQGTLVAYGQNVAATAGQNFDGMVGSFTDGDDFGLYNNYEVVINWGDGSASYGQASADGYGTFSVFGQHQYAQGGSYSLSVQVYDSNGTSAGASSTATVADAPPATYVVSEIPGYGVMRYDSATGWQQLISANASQVAVDSRGDVVAEVPGQGVYRYEDATGWQRLTPADASRVGISGDGIVAAEIPGYGVWRYEDATGWRQLTGVNASQLAIAGDGVVAAEFNGYGVWRYEDATGWQQLTATDASQVALDANGDVAVEINGYGVWRYEDSSGWQQLTAADASRISMAGDGIVAAAFNGAGVWRFEDAAGWQQLAADASQVAVDSRGDVAADLYGTGVWLFQDGLSWGQLTVDNALDIGLGG